MAAQQTKSDNGHVHRAMIAAPRSVEEQWSGVFSDRGNEGDVFHCFRLPLGRLPKREEWPGHGMRVGEALDQVVARSVNSPECVRHGLTIPSAPGQVALAQLATFRACTQHDDAAVGRSMDDDHDEPDVPALFRTGLRPVDHAPDLDTDSGDFTMLSAGLAGPTGSVIAVESAPSRAARVEASRPANGFKKVTVLQIAAGPSPGSPALHRVRSDGALSAISNEGAALLDPETAGKRVALIEVDFEGDEHLALGECTDIIRRARPSILTGFRPSTRPGVRGIDGRAYLRRMIGPGYQFAIFQGVGSTRPATTDEIMAEHTRRGTSHLDLLRNTRTHRQSHPATDGLPN